jgi:tripartite-type tricarboxylate transporter receptor subunit TctC
MTAADRYRSRPNSCSLATDGAMALPRRLFLRLIAGAGAGVLPILARSAPALDYPQRPVHIIVGFPAGTSSDITARLVGERLSERLGQQFVVENRPGAGTNVATDSVVHASPDGYTLLWVTQTNAINATLYHTLNFNFIRDIEPVAGVLSVAAVMMVNPSVPAQTVPEFIAYAKAHPGTINMSSPGIGSINHVAGEMFNMMAGVKLVHIPYRTSQFPDLLSGQVQVTFNPLPSSLDFIRAGKLRGLAVTSTSRSDALPNVPALDEFLPGYEATAWFGIGAPKNTPSTVIEKLNKEINAALTDPQFKTRLINLGGAPMPMSTADFSNFIAAETDKWAKVVRSSGATAE